MKHKITSIEIIYDEMHTYTLRFVDQEMHVFLDGKDTQNRFDNVMSAVGHCMDEHCYKKDMHFITPYDSGRTVDPADKPKGYFDNDD